MDRKNAIAWLLSACAGSLRQSQVKTLLSLVMAALHTERVSLANLARRMPGTTTVKHRIKRVWRFIANKLVEPTVAMTGPVQHLLRRHPPHKPLLLSMDWTDIRGLQCLVIAANVQGRAVPLAWASCTKYTYDGHRSRNAFEQSLLLVLRHMVPTHLKVILLADRGFGRTELGRFCRNLGFHYLFRVQGKVIVKFYGQACRLDRYPIRRGEAQRLDRVLYRAHRPLAQHVVVAWQKGLPKDRDEPWYLMTDLPYTARRLLKLYGRRMSIEQLFRDNKSKRNGWALRDTGLCDPDRLDRLILVLALAYLLLLGVGLLAQQHFRPGHWSSNNRHDNASLFFIGRAMLAVIQLPKALITALQRQLRAEIPNWG